MSSCRTYLSPFTKDIRGDSSSKRFNSFWKAKASPSKETNSHKAMVRSTTHKFCFIWTLVWICISLFYYFVFLPLYEHTSFMIRRRQRAQNQQVLVVLLWTRNSERNQSEPCEDSGASFSSTRQKNYVCQSPDEVICFPCFSQSRRWFSFCVVLVITFKSSLVVCNKIEILNPIFSYGWVCKSW